MSYRPPHPRTLGIPAVLVGVALVTAACGGSSTSGGSPSSTSTGGASSSSVSQEVAFARCLRSHGVPSYPDPNANGQEPASIKQIAISPTALRACNSLLPSGNVAAINQADQREYVKFAQCMRARGVPTFPDPTTESDGTPIFFLYPAITQLPQLKTVATTCQSLLHLAQFPDHTDEG